MSAIDPLDQLRKLAALKAEGIVDEAEFNRLKTELLSQVAGNASPAESTSQDVTSASSPVIPSPAQPAAGVHRITPQQLADLSSRLVDCEAQYQQAASESEIYSVQLRRLGRKLKYYVFLLRCRRPLQDVVLGPIGPILILPAIGVLCGTILAGLVTSSTNIMFCCGLLMGLAVFLFAINAFVFPSDESVQSRTEKLRTEIARTESLRNRVDPMVIQSKELRDRLKDEFQNSLTQFKSGRNLLLSLNWRIFRGIQFELFLRDVLEQLGFQVTTTKTTGDQGVDLLAERNGVRVAVQAKGYAESVGNAAVQQAHTGMIFYGCKRCVVITNSTFTAAAYQLADRVGCILIDRSKIEGLISGKNDLT